MENNKELKIRSPLLVIFWSYGLLALMHTPTYLGAFVGSILSGASFDSIMSGNFENHLTIVSGGMASLLIGIPLAFVIVKYLWRRPFSFICLDLDLKSFGWGVLLGLILPVIIIFILYVNGNVQSLTLNSIPIQQLLNYLVGYFGLIFLGSMAEEIVFRGMAVRELATKWGWLVASIAGGTYFGVAHLTNQLPQLTLINGLWIITTGIVVTFCFVAMYIRSKSLWLPIGFHFAWNYCLVAILGTTQSSSVSNNGLFLTQLSGSKILTGGEFGIEASIVSIAAYLLLALLYIKYSKVGKPTLLSHQLK